MAEAIKKAEIEKSEKEAQDKIDRFQSIRSSRKKTQSKPSTSLHDKVITEKGIIEERNDFDFDQFKVSKRIWKGTKGDTSSV